jgi:putative transposase
MEEPKELSQLLKCLTQSYTTWFNRKYKKIGHLWQGRFKSMVVHKDEYFLDCLHYIEVNPARKGLVSAPLDYLWSSYKDRVLNKENGLLDLPNST